jgi:TolC family type I secretion outer membrane protein
MKRLTSDRSVKRGFTGLNLLATVSILLLAFNAHAKITTNSTEWISHPLSLTEALNISLQQNSGLRKARADLEASHGLVVQTRAAVLPKIQASGNFTSSDSDLIETFPGATTLPPHQSRDSLIQITQSIYEGGRVMSAVRASRLTRDQALLQYQTAVANTLLATRIAYYDVLVSAQQIIVNEASVNLLGREFEDQQHRSEAGTVPRFNVLRAEVAVANAKPPLIRARNAYRIAKNNLVNALGFNLPKDVLEDVPLELTDKLEAEPYSIELPAAVAQALEKRTELGVLRKAEALQRENIINARAGYQPSIQAFAGYDWRSSQFRSGLEHGVDGWVAGGQLNWSIFDGGLTRGKVIQAKALHERAEADLEDTTRQIELEVRTAYSSFIEAREVLDSQQKVQEQADEALRLARSRAEAGAGTQLDVLNAETSLTQARTTQVQALRDYAVARARLERAIGQDLVQQSGK